MDVGLQANPGADTQQGKQDDHCGLILFAELAEHNWRRSLPVDLEAQTACVDESRAHARFGALVLPTGAGAVE